MPIRIKISKRAIVNAVVDTLDRNQNSREVEKLTRIVSDETLRQGQLHSNFLGNQNVRNTRRIEQLEIAERRRGGTIRR